MTRTVQDAALMMQVLSQPDARDSMSLPYQPIAWGEYDQGVQRLRGPAPGPAAGRWLRPASRGRSARRGGTCRPPVRAGRCPGEPDAALHDPGHARRHGPLLAHALVHRPAGLLPEAQRAKVLPYIRAWAESAAGMTGTQVFQASQQFHTTRVATVKACSGFDYVLARGPHARIRGRAALPTNDPLRPLEHIGFTVPFNMSEQPAASVNCGYTASGLPIGLQIAGARFDDLGVLQVAHAFEQIRGPNALAAAAPGLKTSLRKAAKSPGGLNGHRGFLWGRAYSAPLAQVHRVRSTHEVGQVHHPAVELGLAAFHLQRAGQVVALLAHIACRLGHADHAVHVFALELLLACAALASWGSQALGRRTSAWKVAFFSSTGPQPAWVTSSAEGARVISPP